MLEVCDDEFWCALVCKELSIRVFLRTVRTLLPQVTDQELILPLLVAVSQSRRRIGPLCDLLVAARLPDCL